MPHIATLICNPDCGQAGLDVIAAITKTLPNAGALHWLHPHLAAEVRFHPNSGETLSGLRERALAAVPGQKVDIILQKEGATRIKRLLIADMDSTMIGQECIDELADFAGVKAQVSQITERAMRGEIEFEPALRERVALLKGMATSIVEEVIDKRIHLTPGARTLVATMKANGAYTALISGGFTLFTQAIAAKIGFDYHQANRLLTEHQRFTGEVAEPILGRAAKRKALEDLATARSLTLVETLAVGDGANDLDMITNAGLGVAYHAKPAVAAAAQASIIHNDLTALLYAQGYHHAQFVG